MCQEFSWRRFSLRLSHFVYATGLSKCQIRLRTMTNQFMTTRGAARRFGFESKVVSDKIPV
jgi:hypothetical protein